MEQGGLGTDDLGNVSTRESLQSLVVNGLEMNQQCTHAAVKANSIRGYIGKDTANRSRGIDYSPLLDTPEATSGEVCSTADFSNTRDASTLE